MKAFLVVNFMGAFAFDENGKLIAHRLFPNKPEDIAKKLQENEQGESVTEELEVIGELGKKGYGAIFSKKDSDFDFREFAIKNKWAKSQAEINQLLSKVNVLITKSKLGVVRKDSILMQTVGVVDELDRFLNVFTERLREWYGLYSTEPVKMEQNEIFIKRVAKSNSKELAEVSSFAKVLADMYSERGTLVKYIQNQGKDTVPNLSAVAGPVLASRLLEFAGGLEKLAKMSSSKIQLIGAEKALFRHLKGQGKSPKYGLIFSHPHVQAAPKALRGKVARLLAAKLSLAARTDYFSKEDRSKSMKEDLDKQINNIIGRK